MSGRTRRRELFLQIPGSHKQVNAVGKISAALTGARWWEQGGRRPPEPGRRPHRLAPRGRGPRPGSCRRRVWAGRRGTELSAQCDGTQAHSLCTHVATGRLPVHAAPHRESPRPPSPVPCAHPALWAVPLLLPTKSTSTSAGTEGNSTRPREGRRERGNTCARREERKGTPRRVPAAHRTPEMPFSLAAPSGPPICTLRFTLHSTPTSHSRSL